MLEPLAIDLLSACTVMLAVGYAYDIVFATTRFPTRDAQLGPRVGRNEVNRTTSHA